jgi:D-alanyl-D-alanine carboxypeptidase (penicillin-binding protein 5/6)
LAFTICIIVSFVKLIVGIVDKILTTNEEIERIAVIDNYENLLPTEIETLSTSSETYTPLPLIYDDNSAYLRNEIDSKYAILFSVNNRKVLARKASQERMYPASMTKVMTLIVAVESIKDIDDTVEMSFEIINPLYLQNATVTGFKSGDVVTIRDLLYGIVLPSGADATVTIAEYVAGSEENFVEMMNKKAEEIGLLDTHFTNTSGLHDENHYTTAYDMALILDYAIHNDLCRKILSTYKYTTTGTTEDVSTGKTKPIEFYSTMFNKVKSDYVEGMTICGGKTGYTYQSMHCLVSFAEKAGKTYIAVTAYGETKYTPIYDMKKMYENYTY